MLMRPATRAIARAVWRGLPAPLRATLAADARRWVETERPAWRDAADVRLIGLLFAAYPEFRSVFHYRLMREAPRRYGPARLLLRRLWPGQVALFIKTPLIGPGLRIQHGFATIIAARRIGANCHINQQVTIGYTGPDAAPVLGDRVTVFAGAKILGAVTIGDEVTVGANAVVVKDVPPRCTVVGIPARIVRRDGRRVDEAL